MSTPTKKPGSATGKRSRLYWGVPAVLVALVLVVLLAKWMTSLPAVAAFLADYPGHSELPDGAPVGFPAWLAWQHFLNGFFLLLIIRTGWQVRTTTRPSGHWTRNNKGLIKTKNAPTKITLELWLHLTLDALWMLNGLVFVVLLFATGQWTRMVPTSWDVFPNALSAALQYASLNWPTDNGWVNYNALQLLTYFATVFIAAPLAFISGIRTSSAWPKKAPALNKAYPIELARAIHFPVMIYFVAFIVVHVFLVLATGALRNLNHMYGGSDDAGWFGFWVFVASIAAMVAAWFLARPLFLRPIASLMGKVSR
ncbi:cytochrome b/b6 domain-containing protein [Pseudarthrobacter sulfonivorans]|uniref:cytochrome b/b6 domain-containing protein n=1 Tax=Pseudarthrobacter sulfonivorans TaxID=121292 RepID=UPI0028572C89|nr:cytochrome b/b6 domain-containing protein [Pseudarthrobacter sulfonivorans]MDR6413787.1 thiosulfate reductase cytochrome b subunit [Pseudarthrobacter sulfonivorans]